MITDIDNYKVLNLFVLPTILSNEVLKLVNKNNRCIVCHYDIAVDKFALEGVYNYNEVNKKCKKRIVRTITYPGYLEKREIYIYIFYQKQVIVNVVNRNQLMSNPLFGEAPLSYQSKFSDESIKNMVDWNDLLLNISNKELSNSIFSLIININNNRRKYFIATVEQYIYLLQTALVAKDMVDIIEKESEDLVIIDIRYNLYSYFLLLRKTKVSKTKYKFSAISLQSDVQAS